MDLKLILIFATWIAYSATPTLAQKETENKTPEVNKPNQPDPKQQIPDSPQLAMLNYCGQCSAQASTMNTKLRTAAEGTRISANQLCLMTNTSAIEALACEARVIESDNVVRASINKLVSTDANSKGSDSPLCTNRMRACQYYQNEHWPCSVCTNDGRKVLNELSTIATAYQPVITKFFCGNIKIDYTGGQFFCNFIVKNAFSQLAKAFEIPDHNLFSLCLYRGCSTTAIPVATPAWWPLTAARSAPEPQDEIVDDITRLERENEQLRKRVSQLESELSR